MGVAWLHNEHFVNICDFEWLSSVHETSQPQSIMEVKHVYAVQHV